MIILENGSTDGTAEWMQSLSRERFTVIPAKQSLSIEENWARITHVRKSTFMTLIGHDDILYPDFLEKIYALLQRFPEASLYHTHFHFIDAAGKTIRASQPMGQLLTEKELLEGFMTRRIDSMGTGYVMRSADYDRVGGIPYRYPNLLFADFELWLSLAEKGGMAVHPDHCFAFRVHQSTTGTSRNALLFRALDEYVRFLCTWRDRDAATAGIIRKYGLNLLAFYSRSFAHRILRTEPARREGIDVKDFLLDMHKRAAALVPSAPFHPESDWSVRLALWIDRLPFAGMLFRLFKKIYRKPVL